MNKPVHIHTAPWVVPVDQPPIVGGGVVLHNNRIVAVNTAAHLVAAYPDAVCVDHPQAVLTPPLVNAHIHLELSHLKQLGQGEGPDQFTSWILSLLALRDKLGAIGAEVTSAARKILEQQYAEGVSVIADIGNTSVGQELVPCFAGNLLAYKEYLGFSNERLDDNLARLAAESSATLCAAHAIYSTHKQLLQQLKKRACQTKAVLPIHVAETVAEIQMMRQGNGEMVDFLERRGFWEKDFLKEVDACKGGTITYLSQIGLLDERTLCVHAVHATDEEVNILANSGAKVCLCPGSNTFLRVGKAPVKRYLEAGILPALGTDSLASNPEVSIWREMQLLYQDYPELDDADIFAMATKGGAESLAIAGQTGTLTAGKNADVLAVPLPGGMVNAADVLRYLVSTGSGVKPARILSTESL